MLPRRIHRVLEKGHDPSGPFGLPLLGADGSRLEPEAFRNASAFFGMREGGSPSQCDIFFFRYQIRFSSHLLSEMNPGKDR